MIYKNWKRVNSKVKPHLNDCKLANGLLRNFNSKYVNSYEEASSLLSEFISKYETLAGARCNSTEPDVIGDFSIERIEKCVNELHLKRASDRNDLYAEHIMYTHPIVYVYVRNLFKLIVQHGHVLKDFKMGVIIPVVKDGKKGICDIDNYRPVTIISVISNLFELCTFRKISQFLNVGGQQYGVGI